MRVQGWWLIQTFHSDTVRIIFERQVKCKIDEINVLFFFFQFFKKTFQFEINYFQICVQAILKRLRQSSVMYTSE